MNHHSKVIAVIPARYASQRFPGKLLEVLDGESIIRRVIGRVLLCLEIDLVVVVTDDTRIAREIADMPIEVICHDEQYRNGTERVASLVKSYPSYDIVINVQGDEPLLNPKGLTAMIATMRAQEDVLIASLRSEQRCHEQGHHVVKVCIDQHDNALAFSRILDDCHIYYHHIGVYGFRRETIVRVSQLPATLAEVQHSLEQLRWMDSGYAIKMIPISSMALSIDIPEDVARGARFLRDLKS